MLIDDIQCDCGFFILKSYSDGTTKLRSKITFFDSQGRCMAVCKGCGSELEVPVRIRGGVTRSLSHYVLLDSEHEPTV